MSDLQCACTVLVTGHGTRGLAGRVRQRHVAAVYASTTPQTSQAAAAVAAELGVTVTTRSELGDLAGLDGAAPPAGAYPFAPALQEIVDLHRGETVLVMGDGKVTSVELRIDADGWVRHSWAG